MPRSKKQLEELRRQRIIQIANAALEVFTYKGYHSATIANIAKKAGVAKGLVYHYFNSKEELLYQIIFSGMNNLIERFDENRDGVLTQAEMELFINDIFQKIVDNRNYWKLYFSVMLQPNVLNDNLMRQLEEVFKPFMLILIDYFKRQGNPNPEMEYQMLHALSDGIVINYLTNDNFPLEALKNELIKRYVKGNDNYKLK